MIQSGWLQSTQDTHGCLMSDTIVKLREKAKSMYTIVSLVPETEPLFHPQ
jgi:hypothetical protein